MIWRLFPQAMIVLDVKANLRHMLDFAPKVDYRDARYQPVNVCKCCGRARRERAA